MIRQHKKRFGVYVLYCPIKGYPIYVGATKNVDRRYREHLRSGSSISRYLGPLGENLLPKLRILLWTNNAMAAQQRETRAIQIRLAARGSRLLNRSDQVSYFGNLDYSHHKKRKIA